MSTGAPPPAPKPLPGPLAPPEEQFWEKYSPHYEFPLSTIGSVAMHVAGVAVVVLLLWLLSRYTFSDTQPIPMTAMTIVGGEDNGPEGAGSGGGKLDENTDPTATPMDPMRPVPDIPLDRVKEMEKAFPKLPRPTEGLRPEELNTAQQLSKLNDDIRKILLEGMSGKKGKGPGDGSATTGAEGAGGGNAGDPTSSSNRAMRWELIFNHLSGKEYLAQLAVMKATLVMAQPPDFKTHKVYRDLTSPVGDSFRIEELPKLYFIDHECGGLIAKALGLNFEPPNFIAFFPKEIEEELAAKERAYRGRKESEIFSTRFKILVRDNKPVITVIDQVPVVR